MNIFSIRDFVWGGALFLMCYSCGFFSEISQLQSLQLYEVSFRNDTKIALVVLDTITSPLRNERISFLLQPAETKTFSWPYYSSFFLTRRIEIYGSCQGVSGKTNSIVIGNVPDATFIPGGYAPGGLYVITQSGPCALVVTQDVAHKTNPVVMSRGLQIWDVVIENGAQMPLEVLDEVIGPQGVYASKRFIIPRNTLQLTIRWDQNFSNIIGRRITIQGVCEGVTGKTNKVIIGNVPNQSEKIATGVGITDVVPGGMPGGNYRIIARGCRIFHVPSSP